MTTFLTTLVVFSIALVSLALVIYRPPSWLIQHLQRRWPDVLFDVPTDEKILALTIDDGPSAYTEEIARILKAYDIQATFFLIGSNISGREEPLHELLANDHELANHAIHDEPSITLSSEDLTLQIKTVERQISDIYASANLPSSLTRPKYFRPGSGFFNSTIRHVVKRLGYKLILGSIYPWDAQISWPRLNAWHILSSVRPGAVVVIHERKWTVEMLRILLPELKRRGWRVGTVTQLLEEARKEL